MEPVAIDYRGSKGYLVVHRCVGCGFVRPNRVAPDELDALLRLMREVQRRTPPRVR